MLLQKTTGPPERSNLRRIQAFFAHYQLDYRVIACVLMQFVPTKKCRISIDRTNWQFGEQNINILTLTVYSHGVGLPILWSMLDKKATQTGRNALIYWLSLWVYLAKNEFCR